MATGSVSGPLIQRPNTGLPVRMNVPWKRCTHCLGHNVTFKSPREFVMHLRDFHCTKEGGSFVCRYGPNEICPSLPLDGVSDKDYEDHVARFHVASISDGIYFVFPFVLILSELVSSLSPVDTLYIKYTTVMQ